MAADELGHPPLKKMGWEPDESPRQLRRLPVLLGGALGLLWEAAPRLIVLMAVLQVISAGAVAFSLLVVRDVVSKVLGADQAHAGFGPVLPELALLALILGLTGLAVSVQSSIRMLLSDQVEWVAFEKVLDVGPLEQVVEVRRVEGFKLDRAGQNAGGRPLMLTQALLSMAGSVTGLTGLLVVLVVLNPLLVPALLVGVVPLVLVASLFSREFHEFHVRFTHDQRRRFYVRSLLTGRDMAKEVRAFGLVEHLRDLDRRLFEERMEELRRLVRRGAGRSLVGSLGSAVSVGATIGILFWFILSGRMSIGAGAAAAIAIVQLGGLLTGLAFTVGQLYESSLFLNDYRAFRELLPRIRRARPNGAAPDRFDTITVEDVTLTYPDAVRPALETVSLEIRRGEVVALVGENGSGKTTLAKLLCQLYSRPDLRPEGRPPDRAGDACRADAGARPLR